MLHYGLALPHNFNIDRTFKKKHYGLPHDFKIDRPFKKSKMGGNGEQANLLNVTEKPTKCQY